MWPYIVYVCRHPNDIALRFSKKLWKILTNQGQLYTCLGSYYPNTKSISGLHLEIQSLSFQVQPDVK